MSRGPTWTPGCSLAVSNQIEVKEVKKGERDPEAEKLLRAAEAASRLTQDLNEKLMAKYGSLGEAFRNWTRAEADEFDRVHGEAVAANERWNGRTEIEAPTKYQSYALPGGKNYREMLLTLPEQNTFDPSKVRIERLPLSTTQANVRLFYGDQKIGSFEDNPRLDSATGRYQSKPDEYWIDLIRRRAGGDRSLGIGPLDQGANFRSSHWEEPNILAHIRFDDRISDGKKTLHVAEVQSDWHQAGKKKGYALPAPTERDIDLKFIPPNVPEGHNPAVYPGYWESFDKRSGEMIGRHPGTLDKARAMQDAIDGGAEVQRRKIPDAPFKTTWPELAMKRMIRYAAEHGYDRISWDTGATNADRYSLAKQIRSLRWNETTGDLQAKDHSGEVVMRRTASADELPDIIGKEAALKLIDQKPIEIKLLPPVHREYLTVEQTEHQYIVTNVDGRKVDIGKGTVGSEAEAKEYAERYLNSSAKEINQRRELEGKRVGLHRTLEVSTSRSAAKV
jgi:hypothetical protein